jgi:hypothetical protein
MPRMALGQGVAGPVCGTAMPVCLTFKKKPYCHCSSWVLQIFFRGKLAIQRLEKIMKSGVSISGTDSAADPV